MKKEISINENDTLHLFFAGHEWIIKYDEKTNENIKIIRRC